MTNRWLQAGMHIKSLLTFSKSFQLPFPTAGCPPHRSAFWLPDFQSGYQDGGKISIMRIVIPKRELVLTKFSTIKPIVAASQLFSNFICLLPTFDNYLTNH
jgi:hypothetical protein